MGDAYFTVEDGSVVASSNSYVTLDNADTYFANYGNPTAWSGATDAAKQTALRIATQFVELNYVGRWKGYKSKSDQALSWPRTYVYDNDDYLVDSTSIPQKIQDAVCVMALEHINGTDILVTLTTPGLVKKTKNVVGPITKEVEYVAGNDPSPEFQKVDYLVAEYTKGSIGVSLTRG